MVPPDATNADTTLDRLITLIRQPAPAQERERNEVGAEVRKHINDLQSRLPTLSPAQVKRLREAIAEYEARTKEVNEDIRADLAALRARIAPAAPAASGSPAPGPAQPMTFEQYVNSTFPDPAQRTGIAWSLRGLWYAFHRIGGMFRRTPAAAAPPPVETGASATTPLNVDTLPPNQDFLAYINRNPLRLGTAPPIALREAGVGPEQRVLFDIGAKRYRLELDDRNHYLPTGTPNQFSGAGATDTTDISREFVARRGMPGVSMSITASATTVTLTGEGSIAGIRRGGRFNIPRADFERMMSEVVRRQTTETTVAFNNVPVAYTGSLRTSGGFIPSRSNVTDAQIQVPAIRFVEVPRT